MTVLVTGAAGFIGSNLIDLLLSQGLDVVGIDNFSTGKKEFLYKATKNSKFKFFNSDLTNKDDLEDAFENIDVVVHLSANADVRFGLNHPYKDLEQNTIATFNLLETMRPRDVQK